MPTKANKCHASLRGPESFVNFAGFVFEEWPGDDDRLLSTGKDFAAGKVEGGVLLVRAGITHQAGFREREDDTAHSGPIDCAGTHSARFGTGVKGAASEFSFAQ